MSHTVQISTQAARHSSSPKPACPEWWPHLEATEGHVDLAAALVGTVEHLKQAICIHNS
jgi:hypothetical protein